MTDRLWKNLQPQKVRSWGDATDDEDEVEDLDQLWSKSHLSLEEFARCIHDLVGRCELDLDSGKTAYHYQVDDTFVDMMFRNHLIVSVSRIKARESDSDHSDGEDRDQADEAEEEDDEEEDEEEYQSDEFEPVSDDSPAAKPSLLNRARLGEHELREAAIKRNLKDRRVDREKVHVPAPSSGVQTRNAFDDLEEADYFEASNPLTEIKLCVSEDAVENSSPKPIVSDILDELDDEGWSTVVSKKTRRTLENKARVELVKEELEEMTFYFFRDDANCNFMDFVGLVSGVPDLIAAARKERWSHGYCLKKNLVYDFNNPDRPGEYRYFIPNTSYLHKFDHWFKVYEGNDNQVPVDPRLFYVFRDNSTWDKWSFIGKVTGMDFVRRKIKSMGLRWAHAYEPNRNDLFNFAIREGRFSQKCSKAPDKYLERFEVFEANLDRKSQARDFAPSIPVPPVNNNIAAAHMEECGGQSCIVARRQHGALGTRR